MNTKELLEAINEEIANTQVWSSTYLEHANFYMRIKEYEQRERFLDLMKDIAKSLHDTADILDCRLGI